MTATATEGRPVHDPVAERWVIVSMLKDLDCIPKVLKLLSAEMFVDQDCRTVFDIIARRYREGGRYDAYAVCLELERGYCQSPKAALLLLIELADDIPTAAHALYYTAVVKDLAQRRKLQGACIDAIRDLSQGWKPPRDIAVELVEVLFNFERVYCQQPAPAIKMPKRRRVGA